MKGSQSIFRLMIAAAAIIIGSCAKQAAPTGGPKDVAPPVIVKSTPPSGTTNFKEKRITVTFNEFVTLDKLNEKFMVSPPMVTKPNIYLKGKGLVVDLLDELRDSTTYTLYFQDAIRDLNEGNPINNYQYVFATGNVIDSLSLTGNAFLSGNLEAGKNILVMLHRHLADTAPVKLLPDYITIADLNGGFRINNIKEGHYRLFALSDNNNNKRYDLEDEIFAFYDSVLNINPLQNWIPEIKDTSAVADKDSVKTEVKEIEGVHKLYLFTGPKKKHYLTSPSRELPYKLVYTLSLPPDTMKVDIKLSDAADKSYFIENSLKKDTITIWLLDSVLYSTPEINTMITYPFTDSTGAHIYKTDTVMMRYLAPKAPRGKPRRTPFKYFTNISGFGIKPGQTIYFSSATPFKVPDTAKIRLYETTGKARTRINYSLIADSTNTRKYLMDAILKEGSKYTLIADSAAFGNIYGEVSDSSGISFSVRTAREFGHLELIIKNGEGKMIIQLLDSKEKFITEKNIDGSGVLKFPMLEKGLYRVRVIYDLNGDGKWTTGDYEQKLQPEPVSYYPGEIEMRLDFEISNEWDVGTIHTKDRSLRSREKTGI